MFDMGLAGNVRTFAQWPCTSCAHGLTVGARAMGADLVMYDRRRSVNKKSMVIGAGSVRGLWGTMAGAAALAVVLSIGAPRAHAQAAAEPAVVEVQSGDTFSGIAARYTGESRSWAKLYSASLTFMQRGRSTPDDERHYAGVQSSKG